MNLIIDIGNTFTKVAITEGYEVAFIDRFEVLSIERLEDILKKFSPSKGIVSAVGRKDDAFFERLKQYLPIIELDNNTLLPITNQYKTPETLGRDRIAVAVAANYLYPSDDLLVIDAGTAITYDLITNKAQYIGGAISPGIALRYKSLNQHTANLPLLSGIQSIFMVGTNTVECIESGVLNGVIGEIEYFIDRYKEMYPNIKVVFTGGDANFFVNKLKNSIFVVQNLVIIGLNRILEFNAKH
ncbi:MAG TPA: pantothenate kinase [Bacteroidales bacterium]|nr:pantothenate kinase [Bacteroidales bacterium]